MPLNARNQAPNKLPDYYFFPIAESPHQRMAADGGQDEIEKLMAEVAELEEDTNVAEMQRVAAAEEGSRKAPANSAAAAAAAAARSTSIFVGNLDPRTTEADVRTIFATCGPITRVTLLRDKTTQQLKGHAYVEFEKESSMSAALLKDNQTLHGKPLKVTVKRDNVPAFGRGGAFGGFRGAAPASGGFRGRGGAAGGAMPPQMAAAAKMMSMMMGMMGGGGGVGFAPYVPSRGRGGGYGRGGA